MASIGSHCLFLAALILAETIQPERWVHVGGSAGTHDQYLDTHSISRVGDKATAWSRLDFALGQGTTWHELQFDCSARTQAILSYIRDDGATVSHNFARPHRDAAPLAAGSVEERIFGIICR